jgi:DNA-binding transcriptional MerR regulator
VSARDVLDEVTAPLYSVGQVAGMIDIRPAFLRRLDDHGVVNPARSGGNQRRCSRRQVEQVDEVRALMDDGITLSAAALILDLRARVAELQSELAPLRGTRPPPGEPT